VTSGQGDKVNAIEGTREQVGMLARGCQIKGTSSGVVV
jgi:hypothetical protein